MQYFTIFMLNRRQIQQEKHFWMGKGEIFLRLRRKRFFFCVILAFAPPFCQTYLRPCTQSRRVRIIHRVYNLYLAQNNVLAILFQISLAIYCLCCYFSAFASFLLSLLTFSCPMTFRNTYYTIWPHIKFNQFSGV